jgi:hypothetical protein
MPELRVSDKAGYSTLADLIKRRACTGAHQQSLYKYFNYIGVRIFVLTGAPKKSSA